jgi:hypothetical protein
MIPSLRSDFDGAGNTTNKDAKLSLGELTHGQKAQKRPEKIAREMR